jgi:hypothetical protein
MESFLEISVRETIGLPGSGLSYQTKLVKLGKSVSPVQRRNDSGDPGHHPGTDAPALSPNIAG